MTRSQAVLVRDKFVFSLPFDGMDSITQAACLEGG